MALKRKLTAAEFDALSEVLKAEYKKDGDSYVLDVDGDEDTSALRRAKDREAQARKDAEAKAKELEEKLAGLEGDDARKKGDIAAIDKSWQGKLDEAKKAHKEDVAKYQGAFKKRYIDAEANAIATKISKVPSLLSRVIRERLTVDFDGDEPTVRVLDAEGKASALTLEDLQKEIVANAEYADIIIASKASGGAGKTTKPGGAVPSQDDKPADLSSMNPAQLAERMTAVIEAKKSAQE